MAEAYHHPPELITLLVETVPRICRSKRDVLLFFRGAGVPDALLSDLGRRVTGDGPPVGKFEIARTVLARVNEGGDPLLAARREVVKRVAEFDDFGQCWPDDQLEARGLVARLREVVNARDTFTRLNQEREQERRAHREARERAAAEQAAATRRREEVTRALSACFGEANAQRRGKLLEAALNDVFALNGLLVREAFTLRGAAGEGVIEQIDGVVQLDGHLYLVEVKWWNAPLGPGDVAQHLVRLYGRADVRGLFVSYTLFTPAAIAACREALQQRVVTLALLEEIVSVLQRGGDLAALLRTKVTAAVLEKQPYVATTT